MYTIAFIFKNKLLPQYIDQSETTLTTNENNIGFFSYKRIHYIMDRFSEINPDNLETVRIDRAK